MRVLYLASHRDNLTIARRFNAGFSTQAFKSHRDG